jgi:hypothetical protein
MKHNLFVLVIAFTIFFFGVNLAFAQCGDDGTKPCPKTTTKKITPKKTKTKIVDKTKSQNKQIRLSTTNLLGTVWSGTVNYEELFSKGESSKGSQRIKFQFNQNGDFSAFDWGSGYWSQDGNIITVVQGSDRDFNLDLKIINGRLVGSGNRKGGGGDEGVNFISLVLTRIR